jgi:hypothetical protein
VGVFPQKTKRLSRLASNDAETSRRAKASVIRSCLRNRAAPQTFAL